MSPHMYPPHLNYSITLTYVTTYVPTTP